MSSLDAKMSQIAEQVLKRPLTEEEQLEIYKISDVMGMTNVQVRPDRSLLKVV